VEIQGSSGKETMRKTNKAQMIKGNQTGTLHVLSGSLVTYQCGEAENKAGYWPEWSKGGGGRWK